MYVFLSVYKRIAVNTCYIFRGMEVRKISNTKSDRQGHPRSLAFVSFLECSLALNVTAPLYSTR